MIQDTRATDDPDLCEPLEQQVEEEQFCSETVEEQHDIEQTIHVSVDGTVLHGTDGTVLNADGTVLHTDGTILEEVPDGEISIQEVDGEQMVMTDQNGMDRLVISGVDGDRVMVNEETGQQIVIGHDGSQMVVTREDGQQLVISEGMDGQQVGQSYMMGGARNLCYFGSKCYQVFSFATRIGSKHGIVNLMHFCVIYTIILLKSVCLSQLAKCRSQFLLDRLGRCLKLFVSTLHFHCVKMYKFCYHKIAFATCS